MKAQSTSLCKTNYRPTAATSRCSVQVSGIRDTPISPTHACSKPEEQRSGERLCARDGKRPSPPPSQEGRPRLVGWGLPCAGPSKTLDELEGFWTPSPSGLQGDNDEPAPISSEQLRVFLFLVRPGFDAHVPSMWAAPGLASSLPRDRAAHRDVNRQLGAVVKWEKPPLQCNARRLP